MDVQTISKNWNFIEYVSHDLIKIIDEENLCVVKLYDFNDEKFKNLSLINFFIHFNSNVICEDLALINELFIKDSKVAIKYEYYDITLKDLTQIQVLEQSQKNQVLCSLLKIYQFFDVEKITVKQISTEDFLVTDYCDLKFIINDNLHFENINYKEVQLNQQESYLQLDFQNEYIFYQAPEILLEGRYFTNSNIWSLGVIILEIITGQQIFKSQSLLELIQKIVSFTGTPNTELMNKLQIRPKYQKIFELIQNQQYISELSIKQNLFKQINNQSAEKLINNIFRFDPEQRISLQQIIDSEFFKDMKIGRNILRNKDKNFSKKVTEIINNKDMFITFGSFDLFNSIYEPSEDNSQYFEIVYNTKIFQFLEYLQEQNLNIICREGFLNELEKYIKGTINKQLN